MYNSYGKNHKLEVRCYFLTNFQFKTNSWITINNELQLCAILSIADHWKIHDIVLTKNWKGSVVQYKYVFLFLVLHPFLHFLAVLLHMMLSVMVVGLVAFTIKFIGCLVIGGLAFNLLVLFRNIYASILPWFKHGWMNFLVDLSDMTQNKFIYLEIYVVHYVWLMRVCFDINIWELDGLINYLRLFFWHFGLHL